ncbi:hypothetical protein CRM22_010188 [Opisthorchis felineus]|uniref:Reverse transcriptase/retrotransposon-derived protein RNase H-like domain-containing protein n=1 Tax=Opisthorchis felineus TaxID=147828 RepID=A0A4S2L0L6_OPIFE|nr:hypothetical protein CRM22_010188 [Opisthorchis felineus]
MFSDASETGYGVAAYARFVSNAGRATFPLIFGKSRVAPLKTVTVPRLERAAAAFAASVYELLIEGLPDFFSAVTPWTDSQTVLHYSSNHSARFCTFLDNRLDLIQEYSLHSEWKQVKSAQNPAVLASRCNKKVDDSNRWMYGPEFINEPEIPVIFDIRFDTRYRGAENDSSNC